MLKALLQTWSHRLAQLVTHLRGFEETGIIPLDVVAFRTRDELKELGIL